jgi:hypothetical protein
MYPRLLVRAEAAATLMVCGACCYHTPLLVGLVVLDITLLNHQSTIMPSSRHTTRTTMESSTCHKEFKM